MFLRSFILITALFNALGWGLSAAGWLNRTGYGVALGIALLAGIIWLKPGSGFACGSRGLSWGRVRGRFCRAYPLAFLLIAAIALASGLLFEPEHNDGLSFRLPRIFHWIHAQGWHWIETCDPRVNIRGAGFEWSALPGLLFTGSNRTAFLINFAGYLCLPGFIYGTYRRLGVAPRVAWNWMWILPSAYGLVLGASEVGTDLLLVVYALAALFFALRGVERRCFNDLALSMLSVSLLTATKQTVLPLALPWLAAIAPGWAILWREKGKTLAVSAVALAISVAFISWSNWQHTGDWSGLVTDKAIKTHLHPLLNFTGNTVLIVLQNLNPPLFPWRDDWLQWAQAWQHTPLGQVYTNNFETSYLWLPIRMNVTFATFGPGVFALLVVACLYHMGRRGLPARRLTSPQRCVLIAVVVACLVILVKTAMWQIGRHFLPYAFCVIPFLLGGAAQSVLVRRRWWHWLVQLQLAHVLLAVILIAPRSPLALLRGARELYISRAVQSSAKDAWIWEQIPASESVIGVIRSGIDAEVWLWQPLGSRQVIMVSPDTDAKTYDRLGIRYIVVSDYAMSELSLPLGRWMSQKECRPVSVIKEDYHPWYLVQRIKVDIRPQVRE
ncbi:MAG: hypothetical protein B9S32_05010 [Verrucomicrobia bacterium Tous-C9LFEB]|nr:MAG: hypothetical protein B9S32_05010 [Verrucomicrobia bacterium Tous-C9LFEB]